MIYTRIHDFLSLAVLCFGVSLTLSAQTVALNQLDADFSWRDGILTPTGSYGLVGNSDGARYLVVGDSAALLGQDIRLEKLLYTGQDIVAVDSTGQRSFLLNLNARALGARYENWQEPQSPSAGNTRLQEILKVGGEVIHLAEYSTVGATQYSYKSSLLTATSDVSIASTRGSAFYGTGHRVNVPVGIASIGDRILAVARRATYDTRAALRPNGFDCTFSLYDVSNLRLATSRGHLELRSLPNEVLSIGTQFLIASDTELVLLDQNGEANNLLSLTNSNYSITDVAVINSTTIALVIENQQQQRLLEIDLDGRVLNALQLQQPNDRIANIYADAGQLRLEIATATGPDYEVGNASFANFASFTFATQPAVSIQELTFPLSDTLGREVALSYGDRYFGSLVDAVDVSYTVDNNIFVNYQTTKEVRALSGQFIQSVSTPPLLQDTISAPVWESRLSIVNNRSITFANNAGIDTLLSVRPHPMGWNVGFTSMRALPNGQVLVFERASPFRGASSYAYIIVDTLGQQVTRFDAEELPKVKRYANGLILSGTTTLVASITSTTVNVTGYKVLPYSLLERPASLPEVVTTCNESDVIFLLDPVTGDSTIYMDAFTRTTYNYLGVDYSVQLQASDLLRNNISGVTAYDCTAGGLGSGVSLQLQDSAALADILADGLPLADYTPDGDRQVTLTLIDTNACVLSRNIDIEDRSVDLTTRDACFDSATGSILSATQDIIYNSEPIDALLNLSPGTYALTVMDPQSVCSWEETVEIDEVGDLTFTLQYEVVGDSVQVTIVPNDANVQVAYSWSPRQQDGTSNLCGFGESLRIQAVAQNATHCTTIITASVVETTAAGDIRTVALAAIYPNPARDQITIASEQNVAIRIVDALGRTIINLDELTPGATVDVSTLTPGLYQLSLTTLSGEIQVQPLLIER